ncbi:MAG TPA: Ig-like domain-containing protein [Candidatus Lumbricidophila sp.]|nr:Ig-like domain-containing protein [Candidatus Lumbricidophila sp.]
MSPAEWFLTHRSRVITGGAAGVAVIALAVGAVLSGGYRSAQIDLGDGSVWVANDAQQAVGRANAQVGALNTVVQTGGSRVHVVQRGRTVLALDRDRAAVGVIDPVTATVSASVAVPPGEVSISLADRWAVIVAAGDVWVTSAQHLATFQADSAPTLTFGAGAKIAVDPAGVMYALATTTGVLVRLQVGTNTVEQRWSLPPMSEAAQLSSVGGRWVVVDPASQRAFVEGHTISLASTAPAAGTLRLQEPSAEGRAALLATNSSLIELTFDGQASTLVSNVAGVPAAPVQANGCRYAAWNGGSAWRTCDARTPPPSTTPALGAELTFATNGQTTVLTDPESGRTLASDPAFREIADWKAISQHRPDPEVVERADPNALATIERSQRSPVAVNDSFGARPGRTTVLPVLLNDYDPNQDVLTVATFDGTLPAGAKLERVSGHQQLQLTLGPDARGTVNFTYTVDDGRGGTALAAVTVDIRQPNENGPPHQVRSTRAAVQVGGRLSVPVIGEWVDPDGDPMFVESAVTGAPDVVAFTPEGTLTFDEAGGAGAARTVQFEVSDGRARGTGSLNIDVRTPAEMRLATEPFGAITTAGEELLISPLAYVRGGSGNVHLSALPAKPDVALTPDYSAGTFRFSSAVVGTHYLEYSVADGALTASGVVRVDVLPPPDRATTPITVPHTALLRLQRSSDLDVLATDIDPTGGLLVITGVDDDAAAKGVRAEIIEHRLLRLTLTQPLQRGSVTFGYRVSNGLAEASGQVVVVNVPEPTRVQPPVAADDVAAARVGDLIDIPVLANDVIADGVDATLAPDLVEAPTAGLMFVSGHQVRYLVPSQPGEYRGVYQVRTPDGQFATATVRVSVREIDPQHNAPPVPKTATGRVLAGDTVRIPIDLTGIDPDGDSVQLLGQDSAPERGVVVDKGPDWIDYRAGEYSAGTDTFRYVVIDAVGGRAVGTVRVGIAPRTAGVRAPVAVEDTATARPGRTVSVRVLENDTDPDGGTLTLTAAVASNSAARVSVDGDQVVLVLPAEPGDYGATYTVVNARGVSAVGFVTVHARADAPLSQPEVADTNLNLSDVLDRDSIDVGVLRQAFASDVPASSLKVGLFPGFAPLATVLPDGSIRVKIADQRQIIPFSVTHPDDPTLRAVAVISVPGRDDALPQLRRDAPTVVVNSGESVTLRLADYVIAASGKPVRLLDPATVRATHADGTDLVVDETTLRFTSAGEYFGPASISFTVTDGQSASDPRGRSATVVIPIDVRPRVNQPPTFVGGVIDFEPGQAKTIDLSKLTNDASSSADLRFAMLGAVPPGFAVSLNGSQLRIEASAEVSTGLRSTMRVGVSAGDVTGTPGVINLRVVPSTRPLAQPQPDTIVAPRGKSTAVNVLDNDQAGNPFPGSALIVGDVLVTDQLAGVVPVPSADGSTIVINVAADAEPGTATVQYEVLDATRDRARAVWTQLTISVQDRPEPVTNLRVTGYGDHSLTLSFAPGGFNNLPITGFVITQLDPAGTKLSQSECTVTTCRVTTLGNGQAHRVRVQVQARNALGLSDPTTLVEPVWSDVVPPVPSNLTANPLDGALDVQWSPVDAGAGSAVTSYVVTVADQVTEVSASVCTNTTCHFRSQRLDNGSLVTYSVSARNDAQPTFANWNTASGTGTPFGPPIAANISVTADPAAGAATVTWDAFGANGDPILGYYVERLVVGQHDVPTGAQACSVTQPAPGQVVAPVAGGTVAEVVAVGPTTRSVRFTGTSAQQAEYSFVVWAYNRAACRNTAVASAVVRPAPSTITSVDSAMAWLNTSTWDRHIDRTDSAGMRTEIVATDPNGAVVGSPTTYDGTGWLRVLLNRPFGEAVHFRVRSCTAWGTCSQWSQVFPANASPTLTFAMPGMQWDASTQAWNWASLPDNGGLPATVRCGLEGDAVGQPATSGVTCQVPSATATDRVWLDVEVAGVTARFWSR